MRSLPAYVVPALLAVAAAYVFRSSLGLYWAQDDFYDLALATGALEGPATAWRSLNRAVFTELFYPAFGLHPQPYHAAVLFLHVANAAMVFMLARRYVGVPASLVGAMFFAVHPVIFTAMHWISARADVMAATLALITLLVLRRSDRWVWAALPLFILSLLAKESLILLPGVAALVLLQDPARRSERGRSDWLIFGAMALVAGFFAVYLLVAEQTGVGFASEASAAYALSLNSSTWSNLLTYVGWVSDLLLAPRPQRFVDTVDPTLGTLALVVMTMSFAGAFVAALRKRGWLIGAAGFLLLLLPVLFFENHTYRYYLYGPLTMAALVVAAGIDLFLERWGASRRRSATATRVAVGAVCALLVWVGNVAVQQNLERRSPVYPALYGDPTVDRAHIARTMISGLRAVEMPVDSELVLVLRERLAAQARLARGLDSAVPPDQPGYPERNVSAALLGGTGLPVMLPRVRSAEFAIEPPAIWGKRLLVMYSPTGETAVFDSVGFAGAWASEWIVRW